MASYTFPGNAQGWTGMTWTGVDGSPGLGCLERESASFGGASIGSLSIPVIAGQPLSFRVRVIAGAEDDTGSIVCTLTASDGVGPLGVATNTITIPSLPYDSNWQIISGVFTGSSTVTQLAVTFSPSVETLEAIQRLDNVYVAESEGINYTLTRSAGGIPGSVAI